MSMNGSDQLLLGQVALVTGGGRGIGQVVAQALAATGATVAVGARSADQLADTVAAIERRGGRAFAVPFDVTDREAVDRAVSSVEQRVGPVDLLVNNAGVGGTIGRLWEVDPETWWSTMEVNLRGVFLCSRAVLPEMVRRRRGRIVNVASSAGTRPWPLVSAYAISKASVLRFTEHVAKETKDLGVRVFAIHPGVVRLGMAAEAMRSEAPADSPEGLVASWFHKQVAEGGDVPPERGAQLVVALGSGRADALSGRYIDVNDDLEALIEQADEIQQNDLYTLRLHGLTSGPTGSHAALAAHNRSAEV